MIWRLILCVVALCNVAVGAAQNSMRVIDVEWSTNTLGKRVLNHANRDFCYYTLCREHDRIYRLAPCATLSIPAPDKEDITARKSGRYMYFKGEMLARINLDVLYALPVRSGDSTQASIIPDRMRTYAFRVAPRDTVFAMRGGVVCLDEPDGYSHPKSAMSPQSVLVSHDDGTFAEYRGFSAIFTTPGEQIKVGQPLGLAPHDSELLKQLFTVCFFFLDKNKFTAILVTEGDPHTAFTPKIRTANLGDVKLAEAVEYTATLDESLITQEMNSRELKRYQKHKQSTKK